MRRALILFIVLAAGCDRKPQAKAPPSTIPADVAAVTQPSTEPGPRSLAKNPPSPRDIATAESIAAEPAFMVIDQKRITFPPARLRVSDKTGQVIATLYSDDPKEAIDDSYKGNSFYLEMPLDITSPTDLDGATWGQSSSLGDREDTPYGIFLDGHKTQLQPLDVKVEFDVVGNEVTTVWMSGRFTLTTVEDDGQKQPPKEISVAAKLIAKMSTK